MAEFDILVAGLKASILTGIVIGVFITLCLLTVVKISDRMPPVENI